MPENNFLRSFWSSFFGRPAQKIEYKPLKPENSSILSVESIDYCIAKNGLEHHTDQFEIMKRIKDPSLVVRRGQSFLLDITFNRGYCSITDAMSFIFTMTDSEKPKHGQDSLIAVPLLSDEEGDATSWNARILKQEGSHLFVKVMTSPESIVGKWKIEIDTKMKDEGVMTYAHPIPFYLLLNPWCNLDSVYIESDDLREEYVLLDTGVIWRGTQDRMEPASWKYSQFEKDILDCTLYLIKNIYKVEGRSRADPVILSRALSSAVNSNDNNGVLWGNWSGDYKSGTSPFHWVGSMEILQTYYKKKSHVKYGQCWVFAGVLTTVCRAIGIPCRTVTTYESAHDTNESSTIDYIFDQNGDLMEDESEDKIWNFHVWNEVWMKRPDLGAEYDGWQAIDATPQEKSAQLYRCGPSSVVAIKNGEIKRPYDNGFLYSEVNADKVCWRYDGPSKPLKFLSRDDTWVGKCISTKAVGHLGREDITENYKHPEGSKEERVIMLKTLRSNKSYFSRYYINEFSDIKFKLEFRDDVKIGQNFKVVLVIENRSHDRQYYITGTIKVDAILYTGKRGKLIKKNGFQNFINPLSTQEVDTDVTFEEYYKRLVDQSTYFDISCISNVIDTEYEFFTQANVRLRKPDIKMHIRGTPSINNESEISIRLDNPLPIPLTKAKFRIEGCGLNKTIKLKNKIPANGYIEVSVRVTPPAAGSYGIVAKFDSNELVDINGLLNFVIERTETAQASEQNQSTA